MAALISTDLLKFLSRDLAPAQLVLYRNSDYEYTLRVRYGDVHLDYKLNLSVVSQVSHEFINYDEVHGVLVAMSRLVIPPDGQRDRNWNPNPQPVLGHDDGGIFRYEW